MFTNNPGLVEKTEIHPGMSDHNVVVADINIKAKTCKKQPRNVYSTKKKLTWMASGILSVKPTQIALMIRLITQ